MPDLINCFKFQARFYREKRKAKKIKCFYVIITHAIFYLRFEISYSVTDSGQTSVRSVSCRVTMASLTTYLRTPHRCGGNKQEEKKKGKIKNKKRTEDIALVKEAFRKESVGFFCSLIRFSSLSLHGIKRMVCRSNRSEQRGGDSQEGKNTRVLTTRLEGSLDVVRWK